MYVGLFVVVFEYIFFLIGIGVSAMCYFLTVDYVTFFSGFPGSLKITQNSDTLIYAGCQYLQPNFFFAKNKNAKSSTWVSKNSPKLWHKENVQNPLWNHCRFLAYSKKLIIKNSSGEHVHMNFLSNNLNFDQIWSTINYCWL